MSQTISASVERINRKRQYGHWIVSGCVKEARETDHAKSLEEAMSYVRKRGAQCQQ